MSDKGDGYTYCGFAPCGCIHAAVVDEPTRPRDVAKHVADFIRQGMRIERLTTQAVREHTRWGHCDKCRPARERAKQQIEAAL